LLKILLSQALYYCRNLCFHRRRNIAENCPFTGAAILLKFEGMLSLLHFLEDGEDRIKRIFIITLLVNVSFEL
jgi:hypothetical protein